MWAACVWPLAVLCWQACSRAQLHEQHVLGCLRTAVHAVHMHACMPYVHDIRTSTCTRAQHRTAGGRSLGSMAAHAAGCSSTALHWQLAARCQEHSCDMAAAHVLLHSWRTAVLAAALLLPAAAAACATSCCISKERNMPHAALHQPGYAAAHPWWRRLPMRLVWCWRWATPLLTCRPIRCWLLLHRPIPCLRRLCPQVCSSSTGTLSGGEHGEAIHARIRPNCGCAACMLSAVC